MKKIIGVIIILFVLIEIIIRLLYSDHLSVSYRPLVYRPLPEVNYGYVPDTFFTLSGKTHRTNHQGFIGHDFGQKTSDSLRIAVVGSSSVSGSINLKSFHSFCPLLQQLFKENNTKVQILNCGIDGNERSLELFKSIRYQIIGFQPDIILLEYSLPFYSSNNVRENYNGYILSYPAHEGRERQKGMVDQLNKYKVGMDLLYRSYIIRNLVRLYNKNSKSKLMYHLKFYQSKMFVVGDYVTITYTMEESVEMVQALKQELNDLEIQFFLFQCEKGGNAKSIAKEHKLPLISLGLTFSEEDHFHQDVHWNENGCQKVANRFYELFMKYQIIPQKYNGLQ